MRPLLALIPVVLAGCMTIKPSAEEIARADYGAYPNNYKQIVIQWIALNFYDPASVRDLVITEPKKDHRTLIVMDGGGTTYGYGVGVGLRAKNRLGGYTGLRYYFVFIRDGKVLYSTEIEGR